MRVDRGQWRDLPLHPDDLHQERQGVEVAGETGDDNIVHLDDLHVDFIVNDFHVDFIVKDFHVDFIVNDFHVDFIVDDLHVRIVHVYVDDLHQGRQGVEDSEEISNNMVDDLCKEPKSEEALETTSH